MQVLMFCELGMAMPMHAPKLGSSPKRGSWPNGWIGQDADATMQVGLGLGYIVLDGNPAEPAPRTERSTAAMSSPLFSAHVYCHQTVAYLRNC